MKNMGVVIASCGFSANCSRRVAEGRVEGKAEVFHELMEAKFGPLPKWAGYRIANASPT